MPRFLQCRPLFSQIVLGFLALCLTGCAATPLQPTAMAIPSNTPSHTPSLTATASRPPSTPTLIPSQMALPSHTPSPLPSGTPTPNRQTLFAPTETLPVIIQTDMPTFAHSYNAWWHSPDGKWLVENMNYVNPVLWGPAYKRGGVLRVVRVDGKVEWKIDFLGNQTTWSSYRPAAWSGDGNFVYIEYRIGSKDGPAFQYCGADGIWRLDLRDGALTPFLEFGDTSSLALAARCLVSKFSPDALKLAYIPPTISKQLIVVDLNSGKKLTYKFDEVYSSAGLMQWSPDQKQLILVATRSDETRPKPWFSPPLMSSLFWVKIEAEALNVQEVFSRGDYLYPAEWQGGDRVGVQQSDPSHGTGADWEVYLSSQIAIQVTLTPTPQPQ